MALFGFGKKKEAVKAEPSCCCNTGAPAFKAEEASCCEGSCGVTSMKVLGAGFKSCHEQYENCKKAVAELGMKVEVEYITDMEKVMAYGVMSMPGIVVNEQVVSMGKVLKSADVIKLLHKLGY